MCQNIIVAKKWSRRKNKAVKPIEKWSECVLSKINYLHRVNWGKKKDIFISISSHSFLCWISNLTTLFRPSKRLLIFFVFFRPRGGCVQSVGPQLPPVLPLPLSFGAAQRAAILSAHRPHGAGVGRHCCTGREHKDPVLPGYLRTPHAAAKREHLWRIWWVHQLEIWLGPLDKLYWLIWHAISHCCGCF